MKGDISIVCDDKGTHIKINMKDLSEYDPLFLVHALGKGLGLGYHDYVILSLAETTGVLDAVHGSTNKQEVYYES